MDPTIAIDVKSPDDDDIVLLIYANTSRLTDRVTKKNVQLKKLVPFYFIVWVCILSSIEKKKIQSAKVLLLLQRKTKRKKEKIGLEKKKIHQ